MHRYRRLSRLAGLALTALANGTPTLAADCGQGEALYQQAEQAATPAQRLDYLTQAIAVCPTFAAWYSAGRARLELDQPKEALAAFQEARRLADDKRYEALALGRAGEAYRALGQKAEALAAVESALERIGDEPPDWLLALRRDLDRQAAGQVISARSLEKTLVATRNFGVEPRVRIRIQFAYDSADLDDQGRRQVAELGKALLAFQNDHYRIRLIGHTDARGTEDYNQRLSERRARTVTTTLERDFPALAGTLTPEGRGESEPLYPGDSEEDYALNRRVEVRLAR